MQASLKSPTIKRIEGIVRALPELARALYLHRQSRRRLRSFSKDRALLTIQSDTSAASFELCRNYRNRLWHSIYSSVNGTASPYYVPEDVFHCVVESCLNPFTVTPKYSDKNFYDIYFPGHMPTTVARVIRGRLLGPDYRPIEQPKVERSKRYVAKPSTETGLGTNILFFHGTELANFLGRHVKTRGRDLIVQEAIEQHSSMATLNASSINTLRIMTIRAPGGIDVVSTVLRCGRDGSSVDNFAAGGLACGVTKEGRLRSFALDNRLNKYSAHPTSGTVFDGYSVPSFSQATKLVTTLHDRLPDVDLVSWDVAIGKRGEPIVIETNIRSQEIGFHQLCNGPVFEPYADHLRQTCHGLTVFGIPMSAYWKIASGLA